MKIFSLLFGILTVCFGLFTAFKKQTLLFYKIVVFSACSYLLASIYRILYAVLIPVPAFHAGYLAYAGTFLFLLCGFFAEPKETLNVKKSYVNLLASIPAFAIIIWGIYNVTKGHSIISQLLLVPVSITSYYAFLGLCQKSKKGEYAHSFRLYHFVLLSLCLMQPIVLVSMLTRHHTTLPILFHSLLSGAAVICSYRGCKRWYI